jgi:hypothetical protein
MASYQQHDDLRLGPLEDVEKKNVRLRREVCLLREVRAVGEAFLYRHLEGKWPITIFCKVMQVTWLGFRTGRYGSMSQPHRPLGHVNMHEGAVDNMVILAHMCEKNG